MENNKKTKTVRKVPAKNTKKKVSSQELKKDTTKKTNEDKSAKTKRPKKENSKAKNVTHSKVWLQTGLHTYKCPFCKNEQIIMFPLQSMFKYCPDCGKKVEHKNDKIIRL